MADGQRSGTAGTTVCTAIPLRIPCSGRDTGRIRQPAVLYPLRCADIAVGAQPAATGTHTAARISGRSCCMGSGRDNDGDSGPDERLPTDERHTRDAQRGDDGQCVLRRYATVLRRSAADRTATHADGTAQLLRPRAQQSAKLDAMERGSAIGTGADGPDADIHAGPDTDGLRSDAVCGHILYVAAVYRLYTY